MAKWAETTTMTPEEAAQVLLCPFIPHDYHILFETAKS